MALPDFIRKNRFLRAAGLILILVAVYLVIAIPFKVMSVIEGFTDIRPVMLLSPVFGVFFGVPGSIAFAIGNLIGDILSDSLKWSSIAGFVANFLGTYVFYLYWTRMSKQPFRLHNGKALLKQCTVTVVAAAIEALLIAPAVVLVYPGVDAGLLFITILSNGVIFPILIGIPLIFLMQEELHFKPRPPLKKASEQ